jgi:hypothetical protein
MKSSSNVPVTDDEMRPEYDFSDSKPNKYAAILKRQEHLVRLEPDVFQVFDSDEKVNTALRAFINAMPKKFERNLERV